jgi:chemotaxis-related protein WspB
MLMLLFYVGDDLYALDCRYVVEVVPRVILRKIPQAPSYVAGLFNYRGKIVPVIDLCHLIQGKPSSGNLSTRIIMVSYTDTKNRQQSLGIMAERVTETLNAPNHISHNINSEQPASDEAKFDRQNPYLGEIFMAEKGLIQRIRLEYLFLDHQHQYLLVNGADDDSVTN